MTSTKPNRPAAPQALPEPARAAAITAIRLRHPGRIVFATLLVLFFILFILDAAARPAFDWPTVGKYVFDQRISLAAFVTLQLTVYSMVIAIVLGVILAVMRLSPNPVVKSVAWFYLWVFRGTPVYVQLVFWGLISIIYQDITVGIPFTEPWLVFETDAILSTFALAVIGLALNEAAYLAEIVRAGLLSVDRGQDEAATALGMSWALTMRRIIIPQAMRVVIPPTGNEVISMLKTTSLVTAVPFSFDLFTRSRDISAETFNVIPMLVVASIWYLFFTSILMVGQYFLEKRFARGVGERRPGRRLDRTADGLAAATTGVVTTHSAAAADAPTTPEGGAR